MKNQRSLPFNKALTLSREYSSAYNHQFNDIQDDNLSAADSLPSLAIVLPNYNNSSVIDAVLSSIYKQKNINFTLYLMDNCSTDDSWERIAPL